MLIAKPEGRVTFANPTAYQFFGYPAGNPAAGLTWALHDQTTALAARRAPAGLRRVARRGDRFRWRVDDPPPGSATTIVQGSAVPVLADDATRLGAVLTLRDVTTQRDLERQKEEFFANASHDLRTPLMAIKAAIGVVIADVRPPPPLPRSRRMFTNIDGAADEMARMVEDLLELARLRAGRALFSPLLRDLREVAERAARTKSSRCWWPSAGST